MLVVRLLKSWSRQTLQQYRTLARPSAASWPATRRWLSATRPYPDVLRERVTIQCRASGSILLDVYKPLNDLSHEGAIASNVILYLPPGPQTYQDLKGASKDIPRELTALEISETEPEADATELKPSTASPVQLCRTTRETVVQINYRLSSIHCFPTPVHDVLAGYDWIVQNLLQHRTARSDTRYPAEATRQPTLGVFGSHVGGSLALMLGLTECKLPFADHEPGKKGFDRTPASLAQQSAARINWVVAVNPIIDWVLLAEQSSTQPKSRGDTAQEQRLDSTRQAVEQRPEPPLSLLSLRSHLFPTHNPSAYFSPFASPILFLRSPGADTPSPYASTDDTTTTTTISHNSTDTSTTPSSHPTAPSGPASTSPTRSPTSTKTPANPDTDTEDFFSELHDADIAAALRELHLHDSTAWTPAEARTDHSSASLAEAARAAEAEVEPIDPSALSPPPAAPPSSPPAPAQATAHLDPRAGAEPARKRRSMHPSRRPLRYPPSSYGPVRIPSFYIAVEQAAAESAVLSAQAAEFGVLLRRAVARLEGARADVGAAGATKALLDEGFAWKLSEMKRRVEDEAARRVVLDVISEEEVGAQCWARMGEWMVEKIGEGG